MQEKLKLLNDQKEKAERKIVIATVSLVIGIIFFLLETETTQIFLIIGIIFIAIAGVLGIIGASAFNQIKKQFKVNVLTHIFAEALPGAEYDPFDGLDPYTVYQAEFLKQADRFHSEDRISGEVEGVKFVCSDVKLEERHVQQTRNGTRVYYVRYFMGRVFKFEFNKEFVGELQVLEGGRPMSSSKFDKIKMESVEFNKKFNTYATNDLTAFYILTPDIMEAIFKIEKRNPGILKLSFNHGNMYMAVNNNRDTFEISLFRKIDMSLIDEFKQDLMVIKDLIVTLKLNNNLFKK